MADTISDVVLNGEEYQDIYTATGISVGTAIRIQNKSIKDIQVVNSLTKPDKDFKGFLVVADPRFTLNIPAGEDGVWCFGLGPIGVEDIS